MSFLLLSLYSIHISGPETTPNPRNLLQPSQAWICMRQFRLFWDNVHIWYSAARTVGWSNLALFCDFWKATCFCWSGIFLGGQFPKIGKFRRAYARQSFHFQKPQGPWLCKILRENLQNPSLYMKEQLPIIKFEIKSCLIFF